MTIFGGYEPQLGDKLNTRTIRIANYAIIAFTGLAMVYISFFYVLPNDLFTSALFFDGLGLQPVFSHPAGLFYEGGIWESLPDVTTEALAFAMSLLFIQLFTGYRASMAGGYTNRSGNLLAYVINLVKGSDSFDAKYLNFTKIGWMAFYWIVAIFDTLTDAVYRAGFDSSRFLTALIVSFLFYSLFSEWALVVGVKTSVNYGLNIFGELFGSISQNKNSARAQKPNQQQKTRSPNGSSGKREQQIPMPQINMDDRDIRSHR